MTVHRQMGYKFDIFKAAEDPNTPTKTLTEISTDVYWGIRLRVAENQNTSTDVLIKLAEDGDKHVRRAALNNPNCPAAVKLWLSSKGFAGMPLAEFVEKVNND
jgi:hypothetical protein